MNFNRNALHFVVHPAGFGVPAEDAAAVAASTSAAVDAAPNALAVRRDASADASDDASGNAAAADAAADAAEDLFGDLPVLPPYRALDTGSVVGDTVIIHGLQIEGIRNVPADVRRHAIAFYNDLIPQADGAGESYKLIQKSKYDRILHAMLRIRNGERLSDIRRDVTQIHKWNKAYAIINAGNNSHILVSRPPNSFRPPEIGDEIVDGDSLKRVTYIEKVFADLLVAHGQDHNKGRTLYARIADLVSNCPRPVCKLFTDTCPRCVERQQRNRPTAGLRPIITRGFNVRGQVDLIDFQSMADGSFRFLLNYIDHGIKFLFSVPIIAKRASCIALALFEIFTIIGPPMILQSDNGSEFHRAAMNAR